MDQDNSQLEMIDTHNNNVDAQVLQEINSGKTDEGMRSEVHYAIQKDDRNDLHKPERNDNNQILVILIAIFITYSVVVSTIALFVALNNKSTSTLLSTNSCDCTFESFTVQQDPIASGFCGLVEQCTETIHSTDVPSSNPSLNPTKHPSDFPSNYPSFSPTPNPTSIPTQLPTNYPSNYPSFSPTQKPTSIPTQIPTAKPTLEPTNVPTMQPSMDPTFKATLELTTMTPTTSPTISDALRNYIGDIKISHQSTNHGHWLLCDGTYYNPNDYTELFLILNYTYGSLSQSNTTYFAVPNMTDNVIGVAGNDHYIGEFIGSEQISLTMAQLPPHRHRMFVDTCCATSGVFDDDETTSFDDLSSGADRNYKMKLTSGRPNYGFSGWGDYDSELKNDLIDIVQPTGFIGYAFIYAGK